MKNFLKTIVILAASMFIPVLVTAQVSGISGQTLWKLTGGALQPILSSWTIGSSANRVAKIWATDIDSTSISLAGVSGDLNMGGNDITNIGIASSTSLFVNSKKVSARWKDGASVVKATTTDEIYKIGNCLEPGGESVSVDKVTGIIASSTGATVGEGISWNINIGSNFFVADDTLFNADINTNSTSTQTSYTPDVTTIGAGKCWWLSFSSASTTQVEVFNMNLYGYEN